MPAATGRPWQAAANAVDVLALMEGATITQIHLWAVEKVGRAGFARDEDWLLSRCYITFIWHRTSALVVRPVVTVAAPRARMAQRRSRRRLLSGWTYISHH